jgi:hypothetical protein
MGARGWRPYSILELCGEECLTLHEGIHCGRETLSSFTLYNVSLNADFLRLFHELTAFVHGEDENGCGGSECVDATRGVETVHQRHGDIENH